MTYHLGLGSALFDIEVAMVKEFNKAGARALAPVSGQIDALPGLSRSMKDKIKNRPYEAILDIFDPLEDAIERVTAKINKKTGLTKRKVFGTTVDMVVDPAYDRQIKDVTIRNLLRRLRSANHFIALFWTEPLLLAIGMAQEGIDVIEGMGVVLGKAMGMPPAQAKAAARAAAHASPGAAATDWLAKAVGLGVTGADDAAIAATAPPAATGAATVGGVAIPPMVNDIITKILVGIVKGGIETAGKAGVDSIKSLASGGTPAGKARALTTTASPGASTPTMAVVSPPADNTKTIALLAGAAVVAAINAFK
jgi:hypothetical protein